MPFAQLGTRFIHFFYLPLTLLFIGRWQINGNKQYVSTFIALEQI